MRRSAAWLVPLCGLAASCAGAYEGDIRPGGISTAPGLINPYNGNPTGRRYQRIRVIAPPGASVCRIVGQSMFVAPGPQAQGKPNDKHEVTLTYDVEAPSASFECQMPSGVARRTVQAVPYESTQKGYDGNPLTVTLMLVKPPLVHMNSQDPEAEARWTALGAELCSPHSESPSYLCKPGLLGKLKAEDLD